MKITLNLLAKTNSKLSILSTILLLFLISHLGATVYGQKLNRKFQYRSKNDYVINKNSIKIYDPKSLKVINSSDTKGLEKGATSNFISFYKYEGGEGIYAEIRDLRSKGKRYSYFYDSFMVKLDDLTEITTGLYENMNVKYYSLKPGDRLIGEVNPFKDSVSVNIMFLNKLLTPSIYVSKADIKLIKPKIDEKYKNIHLANFDTLITENLYVVIVIFFILFILFGFLWGISWTIMHKQNIAIINNEVILNGINRASLSYQNGMDGKYYIDINIDRNKRLHFKYLVDNGNLNIPKKDLKGILKMIIKRKYTTTFFVILFLPFLLYTHIFYLTNLPLLIFMQESYFNIFSNLEVFLALTLTSVMLFYITKTISQKIVILKYINAFKSLLKEYCKNK